MTIPPHDGLRTYFFFADVEPKEVMNFGIEMGVRLNRSTTLEVMGHLLGLWTITRGRQRIDSLRAHVQDIFDLTLALNALIRLDRDDILSALPRRATLHSWLEARDVEARANVLGTIHARYQAGTLEVDGPMAADFAIAARGAWRFVSRPTARLAFKDFLRSLSERGDDAFLHAYRSIENVRRTFAPDHDLGGGRFREVWPPMHTALGTSEAMLADLTRAATEIRHGRATGPGLQRARRRRTQTLGLAEHVLREFARSQSVAW